jgi:leucyl aminopeptidase
VEFSIKPLVPGRSASGCCVVGVYDDGSLTAAATQIDRAATGIVRKLVSGGDMDGSCGSTAFIHTTNALACVRILLVGLGPRKTFGEKAYRRAVTAAVTALTRTGATSADIHLTEIPVGRHDIRWRIRQAARLAIEATYRFEQMKSKPAGAKAPALRKIALALPDRKDERRAAQGLSEGLALGHGIGLARDLGNLPGNVCTPAHLADEARKLGKHYRMKVTVLEREDMARLGMNTLLSVANGSVQPPKLIVLEYRAGPKSRKPVVLVGKGVTFDTGGISLKPAPEMDEMKFDMSGAGSVLGTLKAVAEMKLAANVIGIIPATENMPGGRATKPGDIVTSMSGQTVEILNTDAEGRLILCDALTYAERFDPVAVIDIATLTGACVIALGHVVSGLFANDEGLARDILAAGESAGDRAWHLPLHEEYQEQLRSNFADFANIGGRPAGAVTAACFLSRFTGKFKWAHLDVAGTAWKSGKEKGSTGRPVPLLTQYLMDHAAKR